MKMQYLLGGLLVLNGCFTSGMGGMSGTGTGTAPAPMNNDEALAYAHAHQSHDIKIMTATNKLAVPICSIMFVAADQHTRSVNQAGPHQPDVGNLDPSKAPLLRAGEDTIVNFPNVEPPARGPNDMTVSAYGCVRTATGMYVVDEDTVLFQKTVAVADQGKLEIAK